MLNSRGSRSHFKKMIMFQNESIARKIVKEKRIKKKNFIKKRKGNSEIKGLIKISIIIE